MGITTSSCPLLNYLILIGKIHIWDCKRTHAHPNIEGFKLNSKSIIKRKNYFASKNEDLDTFYKKWTKNFPL